MKKKGKFILLALSLLCLVFIFYHSLQNSTDSSEVSGGVSAFLVKVVHIVSGKTLSVRAIQNGVRKAAHFIEFSALGALVTGTVLAFCGTTRSKVAFTFLCGLSAAVADEYLQYWSPGRAPMVKDVILDFFGYFSGLIVVWGIAAIVARIRRRKKYELGLSVS